MTSVTQTDFTAAGFGAITPELILRSLIGCIQDTGQAVFRTEIHTDTTTSPVHCASYEDFQINLRRCLTMAGDGYVTFRINLNSATVDACDCGIVSSWYDYLNSLFGEDIDGKVYFNVYQTNV